MIKFNVITLFPNLFKEHLNNLPFKKATAKKLIEVNLVNLRDFALNTYGTVDDKPYGGGTGMVLMVEPIYKALRACAWEAKALESIGYSTAQIILLSPTGTKYNQKKAQELSKLSEITLICGRYEGVDARVNNLVTEVISIGDYILSGGELAAMAIMESVIRLIPGVLEKQEASENESFSNGYLEYPQYTRPEVFKEMEVPKVLLSGNHREIEKWRRENSKLLIL